MRHRLIAHFPIVEQLRSGRSRLMARDLTAGVTVAALLIPQGMAYAELAGLPAVNGLYASFIPLLAYALLGSSRQLALGPTATVAVLTATVIEPLSGGSATSARLGSNACATRWWHLRSWWAATRWVRRELLVATGPFRLRDRAQLW